MFEEFVKMKPEHPTVVAAMFWIGKAKAHDGQVEEAKAFIVENTKPFLNEPKREAVEQLLQQLAQLCSKRPRPKPAPLPDPVATNPAGTQTAVTTTTATTPSASTTKPAVSSPNGIRGATSLPAATPVPLPSYDAVAELKRQLQPLVEGANETGKARLLYAEAELLKLIKREPDAKKIHAEIATKFAPETLSPVLLAIVGDYLLDTGDRAKAVKLYDNLRTDYPKSDYLDYAEVGLGEIALTEGKAKEALELFTHAADEVAGAKAKEATIGKARAQLELGMYAEAKKTFETAASIREWRGETTAAAIYYLGDVEFRQGHFADAIAYYQRVFVAYQKYGIWSAKSYLRSAECFDKLGKRQEAIGHLRELLRNEKLKELPEFKQALKQITEWGGAA
jgi:TolA-binding protein